MVVVELVYNLALLIAMSVVSGFVRHRWKRRWEGEVLQGIVFGTAAVIGMLRPLVLTEGLIFDGRSVMISLCGLFFGPLSALVAGGMASACRLWQGGVGTPMGVLVVLCSVCLGAFFHSRWRRCEGQYTVGQLLAFGLLVHLAMLAMAFSLPLEVALDTLRRIGLPVLLTYVPATLLVGKILGDQDARERFTAALRDSEDRLRTALEASNDGLWDANLALNHVYFSPQYYRMLGYGDGEFPASVQAWEDLLHPEDRDRAVAVWQEHLTRQGPSFSAEFRMRTKDGGWKWIMGRGRVVESDAEGNPVRVTGTNIDIDERRRAEEERERLQAQLVQAQKMESVGRLAGGIAHDFNNMLGVILGQVELALMEPGVSRPLEDALQEIRNAAGRSANLTRQLLAFARKQSSVPKVLDLNEAVSSTLKMLQRLIGENIGLDWTPGDGLWPVKVDPSQVDQILANLCVNARDAIAGTGKVALETRNVTLDEPFCSLHAGFVPGDYVQLSVGDDGCGMNEETLERLFEPFFTTKETGKGTGLGLATVYGIVKQNSGFIDVYSEPGHGTVFRIYLPRQGEKTERAPSEDPAAAAARGHETILLVEDEAAVLRITKRILLRQGYSVLTAPTPGEAIRLAQEHPKPIDLLMTDVIMPEMNGRDLAKALLARRPRMKLLFMSGYTANVIADLSTPDGPVHFIQKPFTIQALATRVREALDGEGKAPAAP